MRPKPPKAVIVGTGHSGTGYTARVLRRSGILAGHEGYYNPLALVHGLDVDVSWLATLALPLDDTIVWHQVREPLRTITSLTHKGDWAGPYWEYRRRAMREIPEDPVERAMVSYVDMNLLAEEHATRRWQVEEIDAKLIRQLGRDLGLKISRDKAKAALHQTSSNTNRHWRGDYLAWDDLPDTPIKDELMEMTVRYGYA